MNCQGDRKRDIRRKPNLLSVDLKALHRCMRVNRRRDQIIEIGAAPVLLREEVVRLCQGEKPAGQGPPCLAQAGGVADRLACDGLDHGKRILDPVGSVRWPTICGALRRAFGRLCQD